MLSSPEADLGADRAAVVRSAKDLIRWCLKGSDGWAQPFKGGLVFLFLKTATCTRHSCSFSLGCTGLADGSSSFDPFLLLDV